MERVYSNVYVEGIVEPMQKYESTKSYFTFIKNSYRIIAKQIHRVEIYPVNQLSGSCTEVNKS